MLTHTLDLVKGSWRYATGLRGFLSKTIELEEAKAILAAQLENRDETFLRVLELGIYGNPKSPYRRLLLHAGLQFDDVRTLVHERGLESALSELHGRGVYVTLDEFKGRAPVRRPGLEFPVTAMDFDNPLLTSHYQGATGGSRGGGTRVDIDFDQLAHETASACVSRHALGITGHPTVLNGVGPPATVFLRGLFMHARMGDIPVKWFSPTKPKWNRQGIQGRAMLAYTLLVARMMGRPLPAPEYHPDRKDLVEFLADSVRRGRPAQLLGFPSSCVRICLMAEEAGLDLAGTVFRCVGEPFTEGKAAVLRRVGARAVAVYSMQEAGNLTVPCANPQFPDDMHVMKERVAMLQIPVRLESGLEVQGLFHTTLLTSASKLMLNVESGDYAVMEERDCGCLWSQIGFGTHIHTVRSYEKLTSEGVMFMGSMLHQLLEETLPARFGGSPLDYQMVEEEEDGVTKVSILASPRLGDLDEAEVIDEAVTTLSFTDWSRRMAEEWRQDGTLRLQRREPYITGVGKILPLHVPTRTEAPGPEEGPDSKTNP